jgi:beta-N-acetylhexosaminidase
MEIPKPSKREWAAIGLTTALIIGFAAYDNLPDEQIERVTAVAKEVISGNTNPTNTTEELVQCQNIDEIPMSLKIGSLVLPMAEVTELDELQRVVIDLDISSFTFVTEQSNLIDIVNLNGTAMAIADAISSIEEKSIEQNGVEVTFALDEEGGIVQRTNTLTGFVQLPPAAEQSQMPNSDLANLMTAHSQKLANLGVDLVFGPVSDVGNNIQIGNRSYGLTSDVVAEKAGLVIDAHSSANIESTLKHFPGLGSVSTDTHNEAGSTHPLDQLLLDSIPAFNSLIAEHNPGYVMVSHASTEGLTETGQPASLSPAVYNLLRDTTQFSGVAITDALNMGAVQSYLNQPDSITSQATASIMAINAGADMVIISLSAADAVVQYINTAVNQTNPLVTKERLNQASSRVFEAKGYNIC